MNYSQDNRKSSHYSASLLAILAASLLPQNPVNSDNMCEGRKAEVLYPNLFFRKQRGQRVSFDWKPVPDYMDEKLSLLAIVDLSPK